MEKKKKSSTLIKVIRKNKNLRERERERTQKFWGENMDWMGEMISNLEQKKKILEEEGSKYKKKNDERSVTEKSRVMRR